MLDGDFSLIVASSDRTQPDHHEHIIPVLDYVCKYTSKASNGTGAMIDLFRDIVSASNPENTSTISVVSKLLTNTAKRDISALLKRLKLKRRKE